jgi:hypothetical protein
VVAGEPSSFPAQPVGAAVADVADPHLFALRVENAAVVVVPSRQAWRVVAGEPVDLRLAASIVSRRKRSGGPSGRSRSKASAAVLEATSPAWAPPMPSATTKIGARTKSESSFSLRWRPVSVRKAWSSTRSN